jgi:hypothetical protein
LEYFLSSKIQTYCGKATSLKWGVSSEMGHKNGGVDGDRTRDL